MAATRWEYESFNLHKTGDPAKSPTPEEVKAVLNRYGELGYQVIHLKENANGTLFFIMGRDTGRPTEVDKNEEWLVEVVTAESSLPGLVS